MNLMKSLIPAAAIAALPQMGLAQEAAAGEADAGHELVVELRLDGAHRQPLPVGGRVHVVDVPVRTLPLEVLIRVRSQPRLKLVVGVCRKSSLRHSCFVGPMSQFSVGLATCSLAVVTSHRGSHPTRATIALRIRFVTLAVASLWRTA